MSFDVRLFPLPQTPAGDDPASVAVNGPASAGNFVGVCFSGGGWLVDFTLNFPNYDTVLQLNLTATEVNLLANLSCWNLQTNADMVRALFNG